MLYKIYRTIIKRKEIKCMKYTIAGGGRLKYEQKLKSINLFPEKTRWKKQKK